MEKSKVLIVEDEWIIANDIKTSLQELGYNIVSQVSSGEDAIKQAKSKKPDLVLMDIVLQGKMNGIDAARQIISQLAIPVVFLTAYADSNIINKAKETSAHGYLVKPFNDRELQATIELALYKNKADKKILESENRLFTTLKSISDAVISTDKEGFVMFMNPVAESLTGWNQQEIEGKHLEEILNIKISKVNRNTPNLVKRILKSKEIQVQENCILSGLNGHNINIELSSSPIKDKKGLINGIVIVFHDTTKQKDAEKELITSQNRLEYVKQIGSLASSTLNLNHVLESILKGTLEASGAKVGMIFLKNKENGTLSLGASIGLSNEFVADYNNTLIQPGEGLTGRISERGDYIYIQSNSFNDSRVVRPIIKQEGLNSFIGVPIFSTSEIVGVMNIMTRPAHVLSEMEIPLVSAIGAHVGSAIRNAQLYEEHMRIELKLREYQKQLQSLTSRISLIEENEKRRIASELHDGIGQPLALSKIKLGQLNKKAHSTESKTIISEILELIDQTIKETRTLTFELSPPILYELGLSHAIQWLIDEFRRKHGLKTTFEDDKKDEPFNNTIRFFLFQAVREILINVVKHSKADRANITLSSNKSFFIITIEDNGVGFSDPSIDHSGFGLFNIRERMNHINGKFEIKSISGRGTRVSLIVPFIHGDKAG